jgi:hypothetical protein
MNTGEIKSPRAATGVSLIFVHNHRHEANIARLDQLLGKRFQHIQHLVPFYRGTAGNVIPVYESSHRFENFFAQGLRRFIKADTTHYLFCADDMILNPRLSESNLLGELGLDNCSGYIKYLEPITTASFAWPHTAGGLAALADNNGANWKAELPDETTARERFGRHGLAVGELSLGQLRSGIRPRQSLQLLKYLAMRLRKGARSWKEIAHPPYPLIAGYADFVVVPADAIADFCHYCGIFAAAGVFVELAVPTALALSCRRIVCEKDVKWKGLELWSQKIDDFGQSRNYSIKELLERFPPEQLYVHPIKLSKWK